MKKHLAKKHNIGHAKSKTLRIAEDIFMIKMQSFCAENQYRSFVVQKDCSQLNETQSLHAESRFELSHAAETTQNVIAKKLDAIYASSEQQWLFTFDRLQTFIDAHVDQTSL